MGGVGGGGLTIGAGGRIASHAAAPRAELSTAAMTVMTVMKR